MRIMVARGTRNSGHMYIKFNLISAPTVYSIEIKKISVKFPLHIRIEKLCGDIKFITCSVV